MLLFPVYLIIIVAIEIDDLGPFCQRRVGKTKGSSVCISSDP